MGEKLGHGSGNWTERKPGVAPKRGAHPVADANSRDAAVKGEQETKPRPVRAGERGAGGVQRSTVESAPDPPRPRLIIGGVEAVEELDAKTSVLVGKRANTEAPFLAGTADLVPGHEALGTRNLFSRSPEEGMASTVEGVQNTGREVKRHHGESRQCVKDGIKEHEAPTKGEQQRAPPGEVLVHLGDEGRKRGETGLLGGEREPEVGLG
jgi:hypothetical protein